MAPPNQGNGHEAPRITILTPSLNASRYIALALESVARQKYSNLQHIVLDAGSKDGTHEIVARFPHVRLIIEPDHGAHDAINKGLRLASGEVIGFLNTDDFYPDDLLGDVGRFFAADPSLDVVVGGTAVFEDGIDGQRKIVVVRDHDRDRGSWLPELVFSAPGFNGRFFRRRVFDRIGYFDNQYYIAADRHFLLRVALAGLRAAHLEKISVYYRRHAGSATFNSAQRQAEEIAIEHARMAIEFLDATRADPKRSRIFLAWGVFESTKLILKQLRTSRYAAAVGLMAQLVRRSPLWPVHLVRGLVLRRAARRMDRNTLA